MVKGTVYELSRDYGAFVAVDNQFSALVPRSEMAGRLEIGQEIEARVTAVKPDGKLDLSIRGRIPEQMDADARMILKKLEAGGCVTSYPAEANGRTRKYYRITQRGLVQLAQETAAWERYVHGIHSVLGTTPG